MAFGYLARRVLVKRCGSDGFARIAPGVPTISMPTMLANIFLILAASQIIKTIREPLILATGGAEPKSYSAAGQALVLMGFIPLYSWLSSKLDRGTLVIGVTLNAGVSLPAMHPIQGRKQGTQCRVPARRGTP